MNSERQYQIEQFYYREARLLDSRQYQQWLALIDPEISYSMPSRQNVQVNNRQNGQEAMLDIANELEDAASVDGSPLRDEGYVHLMLRVERAYKINSWAEAPPARTRRIIGNIEVVEERTGELDTISNMLMYYSRPGAGDFTYSGQRRDTLREQEDGFMIAKREIIMDYSTIDVPTLGLLF